MEPCKPSRAPEMHEAKKTMMSAKFIDKLVCELLYSNEFETDETRLKMTVYIFEFSDEMCDLFAHNHICLTKCQTVCYVSLYNTQKNIC